MRCAVRTSGGHQWSESGCSEGGGGMPKWRVEFPPATSVAGFPQAQCHRTGPPSESYESCGCRTTG